MRPVLTCCCIAAAGTAVAALPASGATASAPASARSLVAAARKAILARSGVHIVTTGRDTATGKASGRFVIDEGRTSNIQEVVLGAAWIRVRVTPFAAYFSGNKDGLTGVLRMPADDEGRVGTKWVVIERREPAYRGFAYDVIASLPSQVLPSASALSSARLGPSTPTGQRVRLVRWRAKVGSTSATFSLALAASGPPLPVTETEVAGTTEERTVFSRWDEHVVVPRPRRTVAYTSLSAT